MNPDNPVNLAGHGHGGRSVVRPNRGQRAADLRRTFHGRGRPVPTAGADERCRRPFRGCPPGAEAGGF